MKRGFAVLIILGVLLTCSVSQKPSQKSKQLQLIQ